MYISSTIIKTDRFKELNIIHYLLFFFFIQPYLFIIYIELEALEIKMIYR